MTPVQRIAEMLERTPDYLSGSLQSAFPSLFPPNVLAILAARLIALGGAQAISAGEIIMDAALAGWAFATARIAGLRAYYSASLALQSAASAQREHQLDQAAERFADALTVLGISYCSVVSLRAARHGVGGGNAGSKEQIAPSRRDLNSTHNINREQAQNEYIKTSVITQIHKREQDAQSVLMPDYNAPKGTISKFVHKAKRISGIPGSVLSVIVDEVNPLDGKNNCGYIIDAVIARFRNYDNTSISPDKQDGSWEQIENRFNIKFSWNESFRNAFNAVKAGGNKTIAIIGIKYSSGGAHVVAIINDNGVVGIVEGQDWGMGQGPEVITDVNAANARYSPDGGSNVGFAIVPTR